MAAPATKAEQAAFIEKMIAAIKAQPTLYGLLPSVIVAQAALESGWGKSELSRYNNLFGVKASPTQYSAAWNPQSSRTVNLRTKEYDNGYNSEVATWRVYDTIADSITDRNALVATNPRYSAALKVATPEQQIQALKDGGYATEPDYVRRVLSVINSSDLQQYDTIEPESEKPMPALRFAFKNSNSKAAIIAVSVAVVVAVVVTIAVILIKKRKK